MANREKIAVVGMAFRLPGGISSGDDLWTVLKGGKDVVSEVGPDRWATDSYSHPRRSEPGKSYTWSAGLLARVDEFDAEFFGISPREASQMDPQQRLLLELTWEAFENGGQLPSDLAGSNCAVYVGIASSDYAYRRIDDLSVLDAYSMTGNTASIASNRISYVFDLHGPSVSLDTACSSSLVAIHQACNSLRSGEASMAIAGGVNMLLHPFAFVGFSKASMLSPNGRCRSFDANGDGYVRAEGSGVLLLKPLTQAEADGDTIHAVIVSSGVNCDGKTNGISMPSAEGQAALLRTVYDKAKIDANQLAYFEAHGTGTAVGDPIETSAIGAVLGTKRRANNPLPIGSVKSNLGHLETASGMAGFIKLVYCLKHRAIPASIHFDTPNPNINFSALNLNVVNEYTPLAMTDKPLLMGLNSFGFGGANAHVILEEYRQTESRQEPATHCCPPLLLSARNNEALSALADGFAHALQEGSASYYNLAYSAAYHRQFLSHRLAIFADQQTDILKGLQAHARGDVAANVVAADVLPGRPRLALVFAGNGAQWPAMAQQLMATEPLFRQTIEEIDGLMRPYRDGSLMDELMASASVSKMHLTEIAQPALFALQVGIVRVLQASGLQAEAAVGHSVGEVAAAWVAGILSLEQAVQVICERSTAQGMTKGTGRMAAVGVSESRVLSEITALGLGGIVEVAAINSPNSTTLAAPLSALETLQTKFEQQGVFFRLLDLDYAFHSRYMDPIQTQVLDALDTLKPSSATQMRFISSVVGGALDGEKLTASYWWDNIRQPVKFGDATAALIDDGFQLFLEIGPHPVMRAYLNECLKARDINGLAVPTLRRETDNKEALKRALYTVHLSGCDVDLTNEFPTEGQFVPLPTYPWQRERHWYPLSNEGFDLVNRHKDHILLGYRVKGAEALWENQLDSQLVDYLADHVVGGAEVMPAAGYVEMALAASQAWKGHSTHDIEDLEILAPLMFEQESLRTVQFALAPEDGRFSIKSRVRLSDDPWVINAVGRLAGEPLKQRPPQVNVVAERAVLNTSINAEEHYDLAAAVGLSYGPAFQAVAEVWPESTQALARLVTPEKIAAGVAAHILHPAYLDGCFQVLLGLFKDQIDQGQQAALIPVRIGRLRFYGPAGEVAWFKASVTQAGRRSVVADFQLLDAAGETVAELQGCRFRRVNMTRKTGAVPVAYQFQPLLLPRNDITESSPLPQPKTLVKYATKIAREQEETWHRSDHFHQVLPLFDVMASLFAYQALKQLGADEMAGGFTLASLMASANIVPQHQALLTRLIAVLDEDGIVHNEAGVWHFSDDVEMPLADDIWLSILGDCPEYLPELVLAGRCGTHLKDLLLGEISSESLLSSQGNSGLWEHLYATSASYCGVNFAARDMLIKLVQKWPHHRRLRILEVGGGSGGLTRHLLPVLPAERCDYLFTDQSETAVMQAQSAFSGYVFLKTMVLDIEAEPSVLLAETYDIVIAGHVVHLVDDLSQTFSNLKQLLARQGQLMLIERQPDRFTDITFGSDERWWSRGGESRLLNAGAWQKLMTKAGFVDKSVYTEPEADRNIGGCVLVATNPDVPLSSAIKERDGETWLLLLDHDGPSQQIGQDLKTRLLASHQQVILAEPGAAFQALSTAHFVVDFSRPEGCEQLFNTLSEAALNCQHIVHLSGLSLSDDPSNIDLLALQSHRCVSTLHLLQAIEKAALPQLPRLYLVTSGAAVFSTPAQPSKAEFQTTPSQSPLWGLGRVVMNEYPDLQCKLIDLQTTGDHYSASRLLASELLEPDDEDEIIVADDWRYALRLQRHALPQQNDPAGYAVDADGGLHASLDFSAPGPLKNLMWRPLSVCALAHGEIEIRPRAAGLNFRDVMYAMGLLSDEAVENGFAGPSLGMELAGRVTAVGPGVQGYEVGDSVIAFAPACFSTRVITKTTAVAHKPLHWSYEEAATIPTTFFTVYYAFEHLARLQPGEKVLIHGAAGGVGIAAIQFARYRGAEIFATAGSDEKRDFVRLLGADHVMDSRSLAFADEIMAITGGEGIDVVLNSLAGEAIPRSLSVLRPFGRFLELGKRDFYENSRLGLRPFRNNISYFGIDADQLMVEKPALAEQLFGEMMNLFEEGVLRPLPHRVFPAARMEDAFRYMQQSRQIGKIVISFNEFSPPVQLPPQQTANLSLDANASYLVTGGLSGFGLRTARWLVEKGARHLILLSRQGVVTAEAKTAIAAMAADGAVVTIKSGDVTDVTQMAAIFADITTALPPLKGIIHSAMVIDDALMRNMNAEQMRKVLAPKVVGAWNLHTLTQSFCLDFFVLYSSVTTCIGNPGQANYVAANTYLESLSKLRIDQGLPSLCLAWGPIGDVGYLTRHEDIKDSLQSRLGGEILTSDQALSVMERYLLSGDSGAAIIDFDWATVQRFLPNAKSHKYDELSRQQHDTGSDADQGEDIHSLIANLSEVEIRDLISDLLVGEVAQILRLPSEKLDFNRSVFDLGMDSLMGVELVLAIESRFGVSLPIMALTEGPTIARIVERVAQQLLTSGSEEKDNHSQVVEAVVSRHNEDFATEELERLADDLAAPDSGTRLIR